MPFSIPSAVGSALLIAIIAAPVAASAGESIDWTPSSADGLARALDGAANVAPVVTPEPSTTSLPISESTPVEPPASRNLAQGTTKDPQPQHTGWGALAKDTGKDFITLPKRKSTWVILGIGGAAAALAHPADKYVNEHLVPSEAAGKFFVAGKYIGAFYTQIGVALSIYTIGRYVLPPAEGENKTNKWSHLGFDLLRVQFITQAYVQGVKIAVRRDRPTGDCCGFPSGHAATAFAVASVLERHLGYRFAWPTVVGAMYVATSRLHDNKHYLSDVLFGAAIGTASGWTVVGRHGRDSYALVPQPVRGGVALMATRTFR